MNDPRERRLHTFCIGLQFVRNALQDPLYRALVPNLRRRCLLRDRVAGRSSYGREVVEPASTRERLRRVVGEVRNRNPEDGVEWLD